MNARRATRSSPGDPEMRIVHGASNIAGIPIELARAQRALGHRSTAALYATAGRSAPDSVDLTALMTGNRATRKLRRARVLAWLVANFDIFHFHFHTSYTPNHSDLRLFQAAGKRMIFHLHGCDIRDPRRVRVEHEISACAECPIQCLVPVKLDLPRALRRHADALIVSTPDLLEFVPGALYLPNPLDPAPWERLHGIARRTADSDRFVVAHAPTDRAIKGTRHVQDAVERLQAEGLPVELRLLEGLSQEQMRRACAEADLIVDQVLIGWVGLFAIEMMALGKPVVAYIRPDLTQYLAGMPVAGSSPRDLADTIRRLYQHPAERADLAERGPAYVRAHHDLRRINERIMELYRAIGRDHGGTAHRPSGA